MKHAKATGEVVEKEAVVVEAVAPATLDGIQGKRRCAWVTLSTVCSDKLDILLAL